MEQLESPIELNGYDVKIKLMTKFISPSKIFTCAGWGDRFFPAWEETRYLSAINIKIEKQIKCEKFFGNKLIWEQGCLKTKKTTQIITLGDGGNPILHRNRIVGMISVFIGKY